MGPPRAQARGRGRGRGSTLPRGGGGRDRNYDPERGNTDSGIPHSAIDQEPRQDGDDEDDDGNGGEGELSPLLCETKTGN